MCIGKGGDRVGRDIGKGGPNQDVHNTYSGSYRMSGISRGIMEIYKFEISFNSL